MKMSIVVAATLTASLVIGCSPQTQSDAEATLEAAAADTKANAEVVGEAVQDGASKAAGEVSKGAASLEAKLDDGDRNDAGALDGASPEEQEQMR